MSLRDGIIVRIMSRRDLQRAGAKFHADVFIRDDGNLASEHRHDDSLADIFFIAFIIGMHCYRSVAQNRFRTNRCDGNIFV